VTVFPGLLRNAEYRDVHAKEIPAHVRKRIIHPNFVHDSQFGWVSWQTLNIGSELSGTATRTRGGGAEPAG